MEYRFLATDHELASAVHLGRSAAELSQLELAERAGVDREFISDLEAGQPQVELAKVLDVLSVLQIHAMALPAPPVADETGKTDLAEVVARFA